MSYVQHVMAALMVTACTEHAGEARQPATTSLSLWNDAVVPPNPAADDPSAVELGVKIQVTTPGKITAIRFYRGVAIDAGYRVNLWSESGDRVATSQVIEQQRPAPGWQHVSISPVEVVPGQTYVASYFASEGNYAYSHGDFTDAEVRNAFLVAPSSAAVGGNGVYRYAATSGFPTDSYRDSNYWVDVAFAPAPIDDGPPSTPTNLVATATTASEIDLEWMASIDGHGETRGPVETHLIYRDGVLIDEIPGTFTLYRDTILGPLEAHGYEVRGRDDEGNDSAPSAAAAATTPVVRTPAECPCAIWDSTAAPRFESADRDPVELGIQFHSDVDGVVTGIRYYKGSTDAGPNVGHLWTANGQLVATTRSSQPLVASFGWVELSFDAPVPIVHGTTYVASYFSPHGGFGFTPQYFSAFFNAVVDHAPLHVEGEAAAVRHLGGPGFPTTTFQHSNFWVDVVFTP